MRLIAGLTVIALGLGACRSSATTVPDAEDAVARIEAESCGGIEVLEATAAAVGPNLLVTVAHTFDRVRGFDVVVSGGATTGAELVWVDTDRDLALLRTDDPLPQWLEFATAEEGEVTRLISAADPDGLTVKRAVVLDVTPVTLDGVGERQALQLEADIQSGDSGSPVINDAGELVGLVFATTRTAERGWAIAADEIEPVIDQTGDVPELGCDQ